MKDNPSDTKSLSEKGYTAPLIMSSSTQLTQDKNIDKTKPNVLKGVPQLKVNQDYTLTVKTKDAEIIFLKKGTNFKVRIISGELLLESVCPETSQLFYALYANPDVMKTFHYGKTKSKLEVNQYLELWYDAFNKLNPFGAFAVFLCKKGQTEKIFIGNISPDHRGDDPGKGELTYLLLPAYQGKGYAKRMAHLILDEYIPAAMIVGCNMVLRGKDFFEMIATSRIDNIPSMKILKKYMSEVPESITELYGFKRLSFKVSRETILKRFFEHLISWEVGAVSPTLRSKLSKL